MIYYDGICLLEIGTKYDSVEIESVGILSHVNKKLNVFEGNLNKLTAFFGFVEVFHK